MKYTPLLPDRNTHFKPLVFESHGGAGTLAADFIRSLGRYYAMRKGLAVSVGIARVATRVVMAVIRGSAYAVDARTPVISLRH
jgi:hypothetical protein